MGYRMRVLVSSGCLGVLLWGCLQSALVAGPTLEASLSDIESGAFLYSWRSELSEVLNQPIRTEFFLPNGELSVEERVRFSGDQFLSYSYHRHNIDERASVTVKGDSLIFERAFKGTATKKTRSLPSNFVAGPLIVTFIRDHFDLIRRSSSVRIHYAVLDRLRVVAFDLSVDTDNPYISDDRVVLKMQASNFMVKRFVDPLFFVCSKDGTQIFEIIGRSVPVLSKYGKTLPVDARFTFSSQ